jgi:DNA-binding MarR family transcriptional regulator
MAQFPDRPALPNRASRRRKIWPATSCSSRFRHAAGQEAHPIDELLWALSLTHRAMRATVQRSLEGLGIHAGQHFVLESLWNEDDITCSTLATRLAVSLPTITKAVARMEAVGVVERHQNEADARMVHVRLTPYGRELESVVEQRLERIAETATSGIAQPVKDRVVESLWRIRENLGQDVEAVEPLRSGDDGSTTVALRRGSRPAARKSA